MALRLLFLALAPLADAQFLPPGTTDVPIQRQAVGTKESLGSNTFLGFFKQFLLGFQTLFFFGFCEFPVFFCFFHVFSNRLFQGLGVIFARLLEET